MNRSLVVACFSLVVVSGVAFVASRVLSRDNQAAAEAPSPSVKSVQPTNTAPKQVLESDRAVTQTPRGEMQAKNGEENAGTSMISSALTEEQRLQKKYEGLSPKELMAKQAQVQSALTELSTPIFEDYFKLGKYEAVGTGPSYSPETTDSSQLSQIRVPGKNSKDQRVLKIVIPEMDHPDLVAMQRENLWLAHAIRALERQAPK